MITHRYLRVIKPDSSKSNTVIPLKKGKKEKKKTKKKERNNFRSLSKGGRLKPEC